MKVDTSKRIQGIITPLVTPLADRDLLDEKGLAGMIEHVLDGGVHGVFLLGTSGEAPSLSYRLRYEIIEKGCELVGGRVPVLIGITDTSVEESIRLAEAAAERGADALVVAPPFYYSCDQGELLEYFSNLADRVPLPVYLYNIPSCTKVEIAPATVVKASGIPNVVGLKDSSGNMGYFHQVRHLMRDRRDFQVMMGPEELLVEALIFGASGGIAGGSNFFPRLYVSIYNAVQAGDIEKALQLHEVVMQVSMGIYQSNTYNAYLKGVKCALSIMGLCDERLAEPFSPLSSRQRESIRQVLGELGLLSASNVHQTVAAG